MLCISVGTPQVRAGVFRLRLFAGYIWRLLDQLLVMVVLFGGVAWIRICNGKSWIRCSGKEELSSCCSWYYALPDSAWFACQAMCSAQCHTSKGIGQQWTALDRTLQNSELDISWAKVWTFRKSHRLYCP